MPDTVSCFSRGNTPAGVTWPPGEMSVMRSPTCTPIASASSPPSTTLKLPACKEAIALGGSCKVKSLTVASTSGSMPRTNAPRISSPRANKACCAIKGAAATTSGCWRTFFKTALTSAKPSPVGVVSSMCDTTASMRSRTSF